MSQNALDHPDKDKSEVDLNLKSIHKVEDQTLNHRLNMDSICISELHSAILFQYLS